MAINDAVAAYTGQQSTAAAEYKDAWSAAPSAGVGQFGSQGPFFNAAAGLSSAPGADVSALKTAASQAAQPPAVLSGANIDALPTTPAGATSTDQVKEAIETTGNFASEKPYVADVTDAGDVGRQETRPDRLAIDDTLSPDEQYRRAWQNEANGYYGNEPVITGAAKPSPEAVEAPAAAASQDDYRLPVNMTKDQFMAERYKHWDSGERDPALLPYNTYEDYVDGWYKSDASRLVNRGAKPVASKGA